MVLLLDQTVQAQSTTAPDAGSIMRDIQRNLPAPMPKAPPQPARIVPHAPDETVFTVQRFDLQGITLVAPVEVQAVLKPWLHRDVVFADLQQALQAIATFYQDRGWYVRPQLPEQDVLDGVVRIDIIEAQLGSLLFGAVDEWPVSRERIERMFAQQHVLGEPLNLTQMNRGISLINELPGVGIKAALTEGAQPKTTDVLISFEPKSAWTGSASIDNQGARSTGISRANLNLTWDNPSRIGDQVQANLMTSEGVRYVRLGYSLPLGYQGWRLGLNTSGMTYQLLKDSATNGTAYTRGLVLSYPWLRSQENNVNFSLSLNDANYYNTPAPTAAGPYKSGKTAAANLGGDFYDKWGGGGTNLWGVTLTGGQVGGSFHKLSLNFARLQRVSEVTTLWFSWSGQRALDNLDSSEKFSIGGAQGVRAYPASHGTGDHGSLFTMEARRQLRSDMQAVVFYDHGHVIYRYDHGSDANTNNLAAYGLRGWGLGLNYTLDTKTTAKLTWSHRVADNPVPNASSGANSHNRVWVNVSSFF